MKESYEEVKRLSQVKPAEPAWFEQHTDQTLEIAQNRRKVNGYGGGEIDAGEKQAVLIRW